MTGISAGIATLKEHRPDSPQKLLDMSDSALYCSKAQGRNGIVVYRSMDDTFTD